MSKRQELTETVNKLQALLQQAKPFMTEYHNIIAGLNDDDRTIVLAELPELKWKSFSTIKASELDSSYVIGWLSMDSDKLLAKDKNGGLFIIID